MNRKIYFCKSWFKAKKKPTEIWTEEQARNAHSKGELYTVLVDSPEQPYCTIDIVKEFVGVDFLDEQGRATVTYHFQEVEKGKLFLSMATHREFDNIKDKVVSGSTYLFERNGEVRTRYEVVNPRSFETATSLTDVSKNYSKFPSFGEYDDLIRLERS